MARYPSLRRPPIGFAHRGARAEAPDNTIEAFELALMRNASGLESDVWLTSDGVAVLDHDGVVGRLRRRRIRTFRREDLPTHIPSLDNLYDVCGTDFELSLDVKDPAAVPAVVAAARRAGDGAESRLWLCHPDWETVALWREHSANVRLVDSTRVRRMNGGPERHISRIAEAGIDAINLPESNWTGGLVALAHRFGRYAFGWNAQFDRQLDRLLAAGIDGVYSDHVDRMISAIDRSSQ